MTAYVIYETATGRIRRTLSGASRSVRASLGRLHPEEAYLIVRRPEEATGKRVQDGVLVDDIPDGAAALKALRRERDERLKAVDQINAVRWTAMSEAERAAWAAYRQALLDMPQTADLSAPDWPVRPS